jgi:hypothetical protein
VTPLDQLRATKEDLPVKLREDILALGAEAVQPLIEILLDDELGMEDSPAEGWPPIHAVELLADLKATAAIEPMLDLLAEVDLDAIIYTRLERRLPEFGVDVLEPALERLNHSDAEGAESLVNVLAKLGINDKRIFDAICEIFDDDVVLGALYFGDYGDPAALPDIEDAIAEFSPDFSRPHWRLDLNELLNAHERLGGVLDDELQDHLVAIDERWREHVARAAKPKVGRNDPCPCKSGKKYKKCCEPTEQAERAGRVLRE